MKDTKNTIEKILILIALAFFITMVTSALSAMYALVFEAPWDIIALLLGISILSFIIMKKSLDRLN